MQIRLIYQLQTQMTDRAISAPLKLCERSGPISACCPFAATRNFFVCKMSAKTWYVPVERRSSSELIDVLDSSETSVAGKWSVIYLLHFELRNLWCSSIIRQDGHFCKYWQKPLKFSMLLTALSLQLGMENVGTIQQRLTNRKHPNYIKFEIQYLQ